MLNPEITAKLAPKELIALGARLDSAAACGPGSTSWNEFTYCAIYAVPKLRSTITAQAARIESLRTVLRQTIVNMGGIAETDVSDEFLCHAVDEAKSLRAEIDRLKRELAEEERSHAATIDTRDCHEERINELGAALGLDEADLTWTNLNDVGARAVEAAEKLTADLAASQAQNAGLREALERIYEGCARTLAEPADSRDDQHCIQHSANVAEEAIAATPAASLAMVKAGALREAASKLEEKFGTIISCGDLLDMADQIELAAKGEKDA